MSSQRVRVVKGSCWPCKKRRVKCDLTRPVCQRCYAAGASCDYSTRLIRWSTRPSVNISTAAEAARHHSPRSETLLVSVEQQAVGYFHGRVWPLLTTVSGPCAPPMPVALEHRVVLLSMCVFAASHRYLQDGQGEELINPTRSELIQVLRTQILGCCRQDSDMLPTLLLAVLLLYLHDGLVDCSASSATIKHYQGVLAILEQLGGMASVIGRGQESLDMLLSEFASADLTTALLRERAPAFPSRLWDVIDKGSVWWSRDPRCRYSLAAVFREMACMAFYHDSIVDGHEVLSMDKVRDFQFRLQPPHTPLAVEDLDNPEAGRPVVLGRGNVEADQAFKLVRAFQQTALIYLCRVICHLPTFHPLVQQHVELCLDGLFGVSRSSTNFHCIIFPLYVAGAHARSAKYRLGAKDMVDGVFNDMRFGSVQFVGAALCDIWRADPDTMSWTEMFTYLSPNAVVL